MSRAYQRPENALKRAQEFLDVGKPGRALDVLYEVIKKNRMQKSEKVLQPIMHKFVELCVDQRKSQYAKEGLYQYRNIFQHVNVVALETAVRHLLLKANERTEQARKESHQAVVDVEDLDCPMTAEEIMLSAVSGEDAQDRSDRTILTPWVKFLWEIYRNCLDLLRINCKVETLYHDIAKHTFKFCDNFNRKTEFRKLCDTLRNHLSNIQKQGGPAISVNINNPETQQLNLETRLELLNYAIKMELWQEAYRAIEDISDLMSKSKKTTKPNVMAVYYQKLALVFWKAGNLLFHAAALFKLFHLLRDHKKNITKDELTKQASILVVSTLAIPLPSAHPEYDRFVETESSALEKIDKLAALLSLPKPPTRASLIKDLDRYNVVSHVPLELENMFSLLEKEFDPLHLCNRMQDYFTWIKEKPELGLLQYIDPLKEISICRLIKQIAQIYETITFSQLLHYAVFVRPPHMERVLVDLVRHNDLQIRIDHKSQCVHFGMDLSESQREDLPEGPTLQVPPSETIRCQLQLMSAASEVAIALILPESKKKEMEPIRAQTIKLYQQTRRNEHRRLLQRQHIIEERKEQLETQNLEREELLRIQQENQVKKQKEEENERLKREAKKREKEKEEEQIKQIQSQQIKEKLNQISKTSYGQKMIEKINKEELLTLQPEEILQRQVEELEKERKEQQKKLETQKKLVDYFVRAQRILEVPKLQKSIEKKKEEDKEYWKQQEEERIAKLVEEHRIAYEQCIRLKTMEEDKELFIQRITESRRAENEQKLNEFNVRLAAERKRRLQQRKEERKEERRQQYLQKKAEEQQQRKDEEMKKQREEEEAKQAEQQREEEERMNRRNEMERENQVGMKDNQGPWRPKKYSQSTQREQEKLEAWRSKDDTPREPLRESNRFSSRDIRRDEPPKDEGRREKDWDRFRDRGDRNDRGDRGDNRNDDRFERDNWRSGPPKDSPRDDRFKNFDKDRRGGDRDFRRGGDRDFRRGGEDRDFRRGGEDRDFRRGGDDRDFRRGGDDRDFRRGGDDRDFRRGGDDRDFRRGGEDRDFRRGGEDRDFRRGGEDRDFKRGGDDRDFKRGGDDRDFKRGGEDRDFKRGGEDRDFRRGGEDRDFRRGGEDRDFRRGGEDRDFKRSDDRGYNRDDRDFRKGGDRDFKRGGDRDIKRGDDSDVRKVDRDPPKDDGDCWRTVPTKEERRDNRMREKEQQERERREKERDVRKNDRDGGSNAWRSPRTGGIRK